MRTIEKLFSIVWRKLAALLVAFFLLFPLPSSAAGMSYTFAGPKNVSVGQVFQVTVQLNSAVDIDTVRLEGSYPSDLFELHGMVPSGALQNVSPGNGVDSSAGTFSFGVFTTGDAVNGNSKVALITLKALKPGVGELRLLSGSAAYSGGEGGDLPGAAIKITISAPTVTPSVPPVVPPVVTEVLKPYEPTKPAATSTFQISSPTQPDPNLWYNSNKVVINWTTTEPIRQVLGSFDQNPEASTYAPLSGSSATFYATQDGLWYVHLIVIFKDGTFSREDFLVRIDTTSPLAPNPAVRQTEVPSDFPNSVSYGTIDKSSGIDHYEIWVNGNLVASTQKTSYTLTDLPEGPNKIEIIAVDRAGNRSQGDTSFNLLTPSKARPAATPTATSLYGQMFSLYNRILSLLRYPAVALGIIIAITLYWAIFFLTRSRKKKR
ncbi:hypothetical protein HZC53_00835 [Candidatus Uhrbacteria bacterium]|nr:hypothetical protein [Candidatus Uhrbacteria bacterium]